MEKRPLAFGIVGTNFISDAFASAAMLSDKCVVKAVYSRTHESGAAFATRHGIKSIYTDFEKMLDSPDIDAVYIASPTFLHAEMAKATLTHGKSALIEKMISVSHAEFLGIKEAAKSSGKIFLEAMRPDFDKAFRAVEENLQKIGKISEVNLEFCQYSSRYDNFKRGIIENAFNPALKNSALSDIGIYPLHLAIRLFGEPNDINAKSNFLENGFEAEGKLTLFYNDFNVNVRYSKIYESENASSIKGEFGEIRFGKINAPKFLSVVVNGAEVMENFAPESNNMLTEIDAFCDTVMGETKFLRFLDVTEKTMLAVDKIYKKAGIYFR